MENKEPKKIKYPYIPETTLVNVEFSGYFINQLQQLLIALTNQKTKDELLAITNNLKEGKPPQSVEEQTIILITAIVEGMEEGAKEQNKIEIVETTQDVLAEYFTNKGII